ncbi:MAG TPA: YqiA/YcfP family alpha/beta fold hydrolase [Bryobacteraceae bacterium]|jgi:pimeloyl-ACP methyl ester carboxylesterase|nr:YqiA/YcfP family alpha/beta fold hydrolase [Bryobacteraceae bacterium]
MRIIYLHGFASGPASKKASFFRQHIPTLEIPDLSAGDFEHLSISSQIDVIDELAAGEPVSLIGSSMGGYVAALYATRHPEVERLVLLAPAFALARTWAAAPEAESWRRTGFLDVYHYGEKRKRRLGYQLLEDALRYDDFPDFRQPALIFHGIHDTVVPPGLSGQFSGTHSNARLRLLNSDHELLNVLDSIWQETGPFLLL